MSARRLREALAAPVGRPEQDGAPVTPRKAAANEHEYLRRFVDPVLMPLIESLLLYQPESIYEFIHDYVDESKAARFKTRTHTPGYAKKLASRRKMVDFMSTSVIPVMDDLAHQILREKPSSVQTFIKDVIAARIIIGSSVLADASNQLDGIEYRIHDKVLCRYKGRPRYYPGVITAVHVESDSFSILYSDGRTEQHVHRMCLKPMSVSNESNNGSNNSSAGSTPCTASQSEATPAETAARVQRSIEVVILIIGIDGAGKTTLLSTLQGDLDKEHVPSAGFTSATFQTETGSATFYDLGGGPAFRGVWKEYYADAHGVMFVVDSSNESVVQQSAAILRDSMTNSLMAKKPLLVFANKRDQLSALAESELAQHLGLHEFANTRLVPCVAKPTALGNTVDDRLEQGLHWLFEQVNKDYDALDARVQSDLAAKKTRDQERRAEQRARVSAWREEREQKEMVLHDKPSLVPQSSTDLATASNSSSALAASSSSSKQQEPEDVVIYCSNCTTEPAVTKCAASKWMPVCSPCASELKSIGARNQ